MYVKRLFYDDLADLTDFEKEIIFPDWENVESIIDKMDGKWTTQITMDNGNESDYLCVGGGNDGLFNIFISENDNETVSISSFFVKKNVEEHKQKSNRYNA